MFGKCIRTLDLILWCFWTFVRLENSTVSIYAPVSDTIRGGSSVISTLYSLLVLFLVRLEVKNGSYADTVSV